MSEIHYIVRKKFKYGKRWYKPGEEFEPKGGRFDKQLLNSPFIDKVLQHELPSEQPAKQTTRRKVKNAA